MAAIEQPCPEQLRTIFNRQTILGKWQTAILMHKNLEEVARRLIDSNEAFLGSCAYLLVQCDTDRDGDDYNIVLFMLLHAVCGEKYHRFFQQVESTPSTNINKVEEIAEVIGANRDSFNKAVESAFRMHVDSGKGRPVFSQVGPNMAAKARDVRKHFSIQAITIEWKRAILQLGKTITAMVSLNRDKYGFLCSCHCLLMLCGKDEQLHDYYVALFMLLHDTCGPRFAEFFTQVLQARSTNIQMVQKTAEQLGADRKSFDDAVSKAFQIYVEYGKGSLALPRNRFKI